MIRGTWSLLLALVLLGSAVTNPWLAEKAGLDGTARFVTCAVPAVLGLIVVAFGALRCEAASTLDGRFTIWIVLLGTGQIAGAFLIRDALGLRGGPSSVHVVVGNLELFLGGVALVVAALRAVGARAAGAATAALSIYAIFFLPLGTITFVWWLRRIRLRESGSSTRA